MNITNIENENTDSKSKQQSSPQSVHQVFHAIKILKKGEALVDNNSEEESLMCASEISKSVASIHEMDDSFLNMKKYNLPQFKNKEEVKSKVLDEMPKPKKSHFS